LKKILVNNNSDTLGIVVSGLCLLHCLATPFLFMMFMGASKVDTGYSLFWKSLDILFLALSFLAIHRSIKTTSRSWIKYGFGLGWGALFIIVINEKISLFPLVEEIIYPVSLLLVGLHLYNMKYCKCT